MAAISEIGRRRIVGVIGGGLALGVGLVLLVAWSRAPQIGPDEAVFRSVDALFTAVAARDLPRLEACERRLHDHRAAGRLPPAAADALDAIVAQARSGAWQSAAERLYDFMKAQRRDGAGAPGERARNAEPPSGAVRRPSR
jgi:hypothetical protein